MARGRKPNVGSDAWFRRNGLRIPNTDSGRRQAVAEFLAAGNVDKARAFKTGASDSPRRQTVVVPNYQHPVKVRTPEEIVQAVEDRFELSVLMLQRVAEGISRSLIISGSPGVGKTHTTHQILDGFAEQGKVKVHYRSGGALTGIQLFLLLWELREKGNVLVLDDMDKGLNDEATLSVLKAALDTSESRKISWLSSSPLIDAAGADRTFDFKGAIIFLTNINFQAMVDERVGGTHRITDHLRALISRSHYVDLPLNTNAELLAWVRHLVVKQSIFVQRGLTLEHQAAALKFMDENYQNLREISMRTVGKIIEYMTGDTGHRWEWMARGALLKSL